MELEEKEKKSKTYHTTPTTPLLPAQTIELTAIRLSMHADPTLIGRLSRSSAGKKWPISLDWF
jgi:hypothetical protein